MLRFSGNAKQVIQQIDSLVLYYGKSAKFADVAQSEQSISMSQFWKEKFYTLLGGKVW